MSALYQRMERDLKLKNLSEATQRGYLRCCRDFARYHMTSPAEMGESAIKAYLDHLQLRGAGPATLRMNVAGLKFLYGVTLDKPKVVERLLWPKVPNRKPDILSGSELESVLAAVTSLGPAVAMARPLEGAREVRRQASPEHFLDLNYEDIVHEPIEQLARVYEFIGAELTAEVEQRARTFLAEDRVKREGQTLHRYQLSDFELDSDDIATRFSS